MQSTGSVVKCFWSGGGACVCRAAKEDVVVDEMHVGGLMCLAIFGGDTQGQQVVRFASEDWYFSAISWRDGARMS